MSDGLYLEWQNRQFEDAAADPGLVFEVAEMHWDAYGGPKKAILDVSGPERALWDLLEWLRYGVMIRTGISERAWWGYVHQVMVIQEGGRIRMSLDEMANCVKVAYAYLPPGSQGTGDQRETDWAEDAASIAEYGRRELIQSMDGATDAVAEARRDAILAARRYPQGQYDAAAVGMGSAAPPAHSSGYAKRPSSAQIELRGWWETMGWRYASTPAVVGIDNGSFNKGGHADMGRTPWGRWCQQFTAPSGGCTVREITVSVSRRGTPADNLKVEIYALDGSGNPTGGALVSESVTGAGLDAQFIPSGVNIVHVTLSSGVALTGSTQYGLVLSRSGALNSTNYYMINLVGGSTYAGGSLKLYYTSDSQWYTLAQKGLTVHNMPFIIWTDATVGLGRQMAAMVAASAELVTEIYFLDALERDQTSFLDGSKMLLDELVQVMQGGGENDRRLLGWVDWERRLRVYEEPPAGEIAYYINRRGQILDGNHQPVGMGELYRVTGRYVELLDVIPDSVDLSRMIDPNVQFVEGVGWTARGGLRPRFRGQLSLDEIVGGAAARY
jgi:hypothetical protein